MRKFDCNSSIRWPTTVTAKPKTSRQNQKSHGKNNIPHDNTRNLTAKLPKSSRQNQILQSKNQIPHGKSKYSRQNQSYFAFAVKYLVLPWGFWFAVMFLFLPWGSWFCREVFCFCRELFGFAVRYFVFAASFLGLPWGILFLPWGFWVCREVYCFCRDSCGPPYL